MAFRGFTENTFKFFFELGLNNYREWFLQHKPEYEEFVLKPVQNLAEDLGKKMLQIDPDFMVQPANKIVSRIYRDVRFSKDKTPYKTNMWITFRKNISDWKAKPAFYFDVSVSSYQFGMGFLEYSADKRLKLKHLILSGVSRFERVIQYDPDFILSGEMFKKVRDKEVDEKYRNWYERKEIFMFARRKVDDILLSSDLPDFLFQKYLTLKPLYELFLEAE